MVSTKQNKKTLVDLLKKGAVTLGIAGSVFAPNALDASEAHLMNWRSGGVRQTVAGGTNTSSKEQSVVFTGRDAAGDRIDIDVVPFSGDVQIVPLENGDDKLIWPPGVHATLGFGAKDSDGNPIAVKDGSITVTSPFKQLPLVGLASDSGINPSDKTFAHDNDMGNYIVLPHFSSSDEWSTNGYFVNPHDKALDVQAILYGADGEELVSSSFVLPSNGSYNNSMKGLFEESLINAYGYGKLDRAEALQRISELSLGGRVEFKVVDGYEIGSEFEFVHNSGTRTTLDAIVDTPIFQDSQGFVDAGNILYVTSDATPKKTLSVEPGYEVLTADGTVLEQTDGKVDLYRIPNGTPLFFRLAEKDLDGNVTNVINLENIIYMTDAAARIFSPSNKVETSNSSYVFDGIKAVDDDMTQRIKTFAYDNETGLELPKNVDGHYVVSGLVEGVSKPIELVTVSYDRNTGVVVGETSRNVGIEKISSGEGGGGTGSCGMFSDDRKYEILKGFKVQFGD